MGARNRISFVDQGANELLRIGARQQQRDQLARDGKELSKDEERAIADPVLQKYETEGNPYYSTARLWDDGIIDPADTRAYLGLGLSISYNAPIREPRFGVFRM